MIVVDTSSIYLLLNVCIYSMNIQRYITYILIIYHGLNCQLYYQSWTFCITYQNILHIFFL